jgi:hypothetical protein
MNMPYAAVAPRRPVTTTMRWQTIAVCLPFALLIDAMVVYVGWLIWKSTLAP